MNLSDQDLAEIRAELVEGYCGLSTPGWWNPLRHAAPDSVYHSKFGNTCTLHLSGELTRLETRAANANIVMAERERDVLYGWRLDFLCAVADAGSRYPFLDTPSNEFVGWGTSVDPHGIAMRLLAPSVERFSIEGRILNFWLPLFNMLHEEGVLLEAPGCEEFLAGIPHPGGSHIVAGLDYDALLQLADRLSPSQTGSRKEREAAAFRYRRYVASACAFLQAIDTCDQRRGEIVEFLERWGGELIQSMSWEEKLEMFPRL